MADKDKPESFRTNLESDAVSGFKTGQKTGKAFKGKSGEARVEYKGRRKQRRKRNRHTRATDGEPFEFNELPTSDGKETDQVFNSHVGDTEEVFNGIKQDGETATSDITSGKNAGRDNIKTDSQEQKGRAFKKETEPIEDFSENHTGDDEQPQYTNTEYGYSGRSETTSSGRDRNHTRNHTSNDSSSSAVNTEVVNVRNTAYTGNTSRFIPDRKKTAESEIIQSNDKWEGVANAGNMDNEASPATEYIYVSNELKTSDNGSKTEKTNNPFVGQELPDAKYTGSTKASDDSILDTSKKAQVDNTAYYGSDIYKNGTYSGNTAHFKTDYNKQGQSSTFKNYGSSNRNYNTQSSSGIKSAIDEGVSDTKNLFSEAYGDTKKIVDSADPYDSSSTDGYSVSRGKEQDSTGQAVNNVFGGTARDIKETKATGSKNKRAFSTTTNSIKAAKRFTAGVGRTINTFIPKQTEQINKDSDDDTASGAIQAVNSASRGIKVAVESTLKIFVAIINFIVSLVTSGFAAAFAGCLPVALVIIIIIILIVVIISALISVLATIITLIVNALFAAETVAGSEMFQYAYECAVAFQEEYEEEAADADKVSLYIDKSSVTIGEDGYELEIDYTSAFLIYLATYETATYTDSNLNLTDDSEESCLDSLVEATDENKALFDEVFEEFYSYYTTRNGTLRLDAYTMFGYADYNSSVSYTNLIYLSEAYDVSGEYATALGVGSVETISVTVPYIEEETETETEAESEEESAEETTEIETETETEAEKETETERETTTESEATSEVETETEETEEETTSSGSSGSGHTGGGSSFTQATFG